MTRDGECVKQADERARLAAPSRLALDDLLAELLRRTRDVVDVRDGLWKLIEAVVSVAAAELSLAGVLDRIVAVARDMVDAQYVALGVIADGGGLREFVHVGMDADTVARIGHLPEGHGILGLLIREPQVLRLSDLSNHPSSVGFPEHHPPMGTFLGAPIEVRGRVYGNLYLTNRRDGRGFTDDDVELITTLAAVAGVVIDNARLHEMTVRRQRWLEATRDVTGELLGGGDMTQVLTLLVARARELAVATTATLVLAADDDGLIVAAADGLHADQLRGQRFRLEGTLSGDVLATGRAIALDDLSTDERTEQPLVAVGGFGGAMCLPLMARGRRLGTLTVAREKGQPSFGDDDVQLAEAFAAQAALALDYGHAQAERRRVAIYDERERIGQDLHDLVIQRLFATGLALQAVTGRVVDEGVRERLSDAVDEIDAAIGDLRSSIFGLHARRHGMSSLVRQVEEICAAAAAMLGFAPDCRIDPAVDGVVSDELVPDLLAVVRETLTNVSRHADASHVDLHLHMHDEMVRLEVTDNGRGIRPTGRRSGIANMRARAERLNGVMDIGRAPTGGTYLMWTVPAK
jgi:signal transduction histidine kinase